MNHFEQLAQRQMVAATKAKHRAAEKRAAAKVVKSEKDAPMKLSPMEQATVDTSKQYRAYTKSRRTELKALLTGARSEYWRELIGVLRVITLDSESDLIEYVKTQRWLYDSDRSTRQFALSIIADRMIKLRLENGYPPFNDSLLGEPPTTFEIIRNELQVLTP